MLNDGFVRIAAMTPQIKVADSQANAEGSFKAISDAYEEGADIVVLPECTMTTYISNDFLYQDILLDAAEEQLGELVKRTADMDVIFTVGIPLRVNTKLYNTVAVCHAGRILGIVPKSNIPTYGVDFEGRWFEPGPAETTPISVAGFDDVPFGSKMLFRNSNLPEMCMAVEICEDIWCPDPPSIKHALAGATIICNSSASNASADKARYRRGLIGGQSARLICCYTYCSSGQGDSTGNVTVGGHNIIAENGNILGEARPFGSGCAIADVDVASLCGGRRGMSSFKVSPTPQDVGYRIVEFDEKIDAHKKDGEKVMRPVSPKPFVPTNADELDERCDLVLNMQSHALLARMEHSGQYKLVLGLDGDIDSQLAALVCIKAIGLAVDAGHDASLTMVDVTEGVVATSFADSLNSECITAEGATSEERDAFLKGYASDEGALLIGTQDMTRLVLEDSAIPSDLHNVYMPNMGVGHTLVHAMLMHEGISEACAMDDIDLGMPTDVADFFLSAMLDSKYPPKKTFRLARQAFEGSYKADELLSWLRRFYERFFETQYARNCLPDGPRIASATISWRDYYMLPDNASSRLWMEELDSITI